MKEWQATLTLFLSVMSFVQKVRITFISFAITHYELLGLKIRIVYE